MSGFVTGYLDKTIPLRIYDIGSQGVGQKNNMKGTYRGLFDSDMWGYVGVDIKEASNVDHVLDDFYDWNIDSDVADVVISGQCLEHIEYPWLTFKEIVRILKPGGLMCLIVPSSGREHKHPLDCWRIFPDGMNALCKMYGAEPLVCEIPKGADPKWRDCVLIARKPKQKE